jgi:hypothetical protein
MAQTLPNRNSPTFAMYYDGIDASRFGVGGKARRTALGNALLNFTDSEVTASTARLLVLPDVTNGSIFAAHTTQTMTHSIRFKSATGTDYYIMCTNAATNRS